MNSKSFGPCSGTAGAANCIAPCPPRYIACTSPDVDLHPAPGKAILECGTAVNQQITTTTTSIYVASVEIDTTCLCYPHLKLEFSTLLDFTGTFVAGNNITLQLTRTCDNSTTPTPLKTTAINLPVIIPTVTVGGVPTPGTATFIKTLPYSFIYCIPNPPSKDCTYTLQVISATIAATGTVQLRDTAIAAFAVGGQRFC